MIQQQWLVRLLNVRPEEKKPVLYLMTFSFFVGLAMTFYFAAANAIFLKHFQSYMISVSYMASGVIVFAAWWLLSRLDRRLNLPRQLIVKFLFVFITVASISTGVWMFDSPWLVFIMFTWIRILVYVTLVTFWGLAGKLFNIRQGKRVFGLLGIGEVISIIIGYFSVPLLLRFLKAADLLFLSSGALFFCLIFVFIILRVFRAELTETGAAPGKIIPEKDKGPDYWTLVKKPYYLVISFMALLPIFGYLFVDFLFLAQTKKEFANNPETIAGFFGIFLGFVAVIELLFKFVSGRFLSKYGVKPSLISLPLILFAGIILAAISGTLYGPVGMFFAFIALARLFERSVRSAIYEPAFQLLYQPLPPGHRLIFQNQIEGIPKASGTVITGAVILLFSSVVTFNLVHYSWFFIAVLGVWIWLAFRMYEQYRSMLKTKLGELRKDEGEIQPVKELIQRNLMDSECADLLETIRTLYASHPVVVEEVLPEIYRNADEAKKNILLDFIGNNQMMSLQPFLRKELADLDHSNIPDKVEDIFKKLSNSELHQSGYLSGLSQSGNPADRRKAARIIGASGRYDTFRLLTGLMKDTDPWVRREAVLSAGRTRRIELWPYIIENLADYRFASVARSGLKMIGEPVLSDLERLFDKSGDSPDTRLNIISIFEAVESPQSLKFLRSRIFHPDKNIRKRILAALSMHNYRATVAESAGIKNYIEEAVENIIWIHASILDVRKSVQADDLQMALLDQLEEDKEYLFLLLSLLYEPKTIRHIRENIESRDTTARVYALEIGDMLIGEDIKQILFPVFEEMSMQERLQRFEARFPQEQLEPLQRIIDIIYRDSASSGYWAKACAIENMVSLESKESDLITTVLAATMVHPHPLMAGQAAWTMRRLNEHSFMETSARLASAGQLPATSILHTIRNSEPGSRPLLFEQTKMVKSTELFYNISENDIVNILLKHPEIQCYRIQDDAGADPVVSGMTLAGEGCRVVMPDYVFFELVAISTDLARSFLSYTHKKPLKEGS